MTLIVGENGTGKTTVLDAVDIGLGGKYRAESRARIDDFSNFEKQIEIECLTDRYKVNGIKNSCFASTVLANN
ncbi:MAG: ATP-binding protein [Pseudomonadota bacterium]